MRYILIYLLSNIFFITTCFAEPISFETFSQLLGKSLILGFNGLSERDRDVQDVKKCIDDGLIGGVILSKNNIENPAQAKALTSYLQQGRKILIGIDQEGGKVVRLNKTNGFTYDMPSAKSYANAEAVYQAFDTAGHMLKSIGVNVDFAPVLDVDYSPPSPVIGKIERSFSSDVNVVVEYGKEAIRGLNNSSILACGKHFPGHGSAQQDTHLGWANVTDTWSAKELEPFVQLKDMLPLIMVAHTFNKNLDPKLPASLSPSTYRILQGYTGAFVVDDYFMAAVSEKYSETEFAVMALNAGATFLIFSSAPKMSLSTASDDRSIKKSVTAFHRSIYESYVDGAFKITVLRKRSKKVEEIQGLF